MEHFAKLLNIVDTNESSQKFRHMKDDIVGFLLQNLEKLCLLEKEYHSNILRPIPNSYFAEYKQRYKEILEPVCVKHFLKKRCYAGSVSSMARYDYLSRNCYKIKFIMKSAKKSTVEIYCNNSLNEKDQFTLNEIDGCWKISGIKHGYGDEDKWSQCPI